MEPIRVFPGEGSEDVSIPPRVLAGDFGGWLRDAMAARRLTSRAVAMRTGLDHTTVHRLATGDRQPSLATAVALLRLLGAAPLRFGAPERTPERRLEIVVN